MSLSIGQQEARGPLWMSPEVRLAVYVFTIGEHCPDDCHNYSSEYQYVE